LKYHCEGIPHSKWKNEVGIIDPDPNVRNGMLFQSNDGKKMTWHVY